MATKLSRETEKQSITSIKRFVAEKMDLDDEIGDLKGALLLDFFLKELGPVIYNQAIKDAQANMQDRVTDLDATCYQPEFTYWKNQ